MTSKDFPNFCYFTVFMIRLNKKLKQYVSKYKIITLKIYKKMPCMMEIIDTCTASYTKEKKIIL